MKFKENNLEDIDTNYYPDIKKFKIAIIVSEWNNRVTDRLYKGAFQTLIKYHVLKSNIIKIDVPGS